ncbi:hypothetical protein Esti_001566 [Eimeria stiedai]
MLDPQKSDYLTRVIDVAADIEKRVPPPSLCGDSRRPKSLSCPTLTGRQPHAEQSGGTVEDIKLTSAYQLAFNPYLWIQRQEGTHIHRPNEQRPQQQRTPSRSKSEPVSAVGLSQNAKSEIIHLGGPTPEGVSAQMPDDPGARDTQTQRGRHYRPKSTLADSETYHELGRKREAAGRDGGSLSLTEERAYRAIAEKRAIHFGVDLPRWVESNDWVYRDGEQPRCASMSLHSNSEGKIYVEISLLVRLF